MHKHKHTHKVHPLNLFSGSILSILEFAKINQRKILKYLTHNIAGIGKSSKSQY